MKRIKNFQAMLIYFCAQSLNYKIVFSILHIHVQFASHVYIRPMYYIHKGMQYHVKNFVQAGMI